MFSQVLLALLRSRLLLPFQLLNFGWISANHRVLQGLVLLPGILDASSE